MSRNAELFDCRLRQLMRKYDQEGDDSGSIAVTLTAELVSLLRSPSCADGARQTIIKVFRELIADLESVNQPTMSLRERVLHDDNIWMRQALQRVVSWSLDNPSPVATEVRAMTLMPQASEEDAS
jgi:hypothetical protein